MKARGISILAAILLVAGCGPTGAGPPTSPASPAPSEPVTMVPGPTSTTVPLLRPERCGSTPPVQFALLCQAGELIAGTYLDPPDPDSLAAAASLGVSEVVSETTASPPGPALPCAVPEPESFARVCAAIAERVAGGGPPVEELAEGAVQGMFRYGLDPFSSYVPPDLAERLDLLGPGVVYSVGVIVGGRDPSGGACGPLSAGCRFTVLAVFPFTSAEAEGVVPGDVIRAVDGREVDGLSVDEATALMVGPPGTTVRLTLERLAGPLDKALLHEDIRFTPAEFQMLTPSVAYLRLNDFSQIAAQLTGRVLELSDVEAARAMILDLRGNPGGLVLSAQAIASQFLEGGQILIETTREGEHELPVVEGGLARPQMDLVVLVDRGSASASEIVAAILQERGRATVVGEPTFGKDLIQEIHTARNGGEIRLTVASWTTPAGGDIGLRGVQPDVLVPAPVDGDGDPALERALDLLGA